jgi:hypothetical protein
MAITDETTRTDATTTRTYPPPERTNGGRGWTIAAFVCAVIAVVLIPIAFGPIGMVLGYVGHRQGDPLGRWAMGAAFLGLALGMVLAAVVLSANGGSAGS